MADDPIDLAREQIRLLNELRTSTLRISDRLAGIEAEMRSDRHRQQAVEQAVVAVAEQIVNVNRRLDDVIDEIRRATVR